MATPNSSYAAQMHALTPGALGPYLDEFTAELANNGYAQLTISEYAASIAHFGGWLERQRKHLRYVCIRLPVVGLFCGKAYAHSTVFT